MVMLCRSEGNWGEYGLSKAAVNCYTIELGKRYHAIQLGPKCEMAIKSENLQVPKDYKHQLLSWLH